MYKPFINYNQGNVYMSLHKPIKIYSLKYLITDYHLIYTMSKYFEWIRLTNEFRKIISPEETLIGDL